MLHKIFFSSFWAWRDLTCHPRRRQHLAEAPRIGRRLYKSDLDASTPLPGRVDAHCFQCLALRSHCEHKQNLKCSPPRADKQHARCDCPADGPRRRLFASRPDSSLHSELLRQRRRNPHYAAYPAALAACRLAIVPCGPAVRSQCK